MNRDDLMIQRPRKWRKSVLLTDCLDVLPAIQLGEVSAPAPLLSMFSGLVARSGLGKETISNEKDATPGGSFAYLPGMNCEK